MHSFRRCTRSEDALVQKMRWFRISALHRIYQPWPRAGRRARAAPGAGCPILATSLSLSPGWEGTSPLRQNANAPMQNHCHPDPERREGEGSAVAFRVLPQSLERSVRPSAPVMAARLAATLGGVWRISEWEVLCQGTTSVVPKRRQKRRASAPEGRSPGAPQRLDRFTKHCLRE